MDEAQVKALLTAALGEFKTGLMTEISGVVDQKNAGTAASMARDLKVVKDAIAAIQPKPEDPKPETTDPAKPAPATDPNGLALQALQQQIAALTKQVETERTSAFNAQAQSLLSGAIAQAKFVSPTVAQDLLMARWGGKLQQEGGRWFVKDGDAVTPFDEAFKTFTTSDEGKFFLPPSGTQGAGSTESKSKSTTASTTPSNSIDAFGAAFADVGG